MNESLRPLVMELGKSGLGVLAASSLKLADRFDFGDSFVLQNASNGFIYYLVSDAINYASLGKSKIISMDLMGALDDTGFFSALSAVGSVVNASEQIAGIVGNVVTDGKTVALVVDTAILAGGRILANYIDSNASAPAFLHVVRHPTRFFNQ